MPVRSAEQAMLLVDAGNRARATAATNLNEHSSRSHSILTIHVESQRKVKLVTIRVTHKGATSDSIPIELIQVGGDDMKHDTVTIPSITCGESLNVTFEIYLSKQQGTYASI